MGIAEAVVASINSCPVATHPHLYANIVVTGGCSLFPNFQKRLLKDIRKLAPDEYEVNVTLPEKYVVVLHVFLIFDSLEMVIHGVNFSSIHYSPLTYAWEGGSLLSKNPEFYSFVVTKEEYEEEGLHICYERFDV